MATLRRFPLGSQILPHLVKECRSARRHCREWSRVASRGHSKRSLVANHTVTLASQHSAKDRLPEALTFDVRAKDAKIMIDKSKVAS